MANPQPTDAHLRMAHSISEAIMLRDFSKRQRKILDLILRLSWGCGKKYAYIPYQKDFQVAGIYEVDIKKEVEWLIASKIISQEGYYYWFNKDFDEWQVSRVRVGSPEVLRIRLSELLRLNLNGNHPLSNSLSQLPKLSELLSEKDDKLSETLSADLVKHEPETSQNTKFATPELASPKEILKKDIYKDIKYRDIDKYLIKTTGQSFEKALKIVTGELDATHSVKKRLLDELASFGIKGE